MKKLTLALAFFPLALFAGKTERAFTNDHVKPAIKAAEGAYKAACGCDLKITFTEDKFKSYDDLSKVKSVADSVATGAKAHCTDAESKKAVCAMKSLEITKGTQTAFTVSGGRGLASCDTSTSVSWEMMIDQLDN